MRHDRTPEWRVHGFVSSFVHEWVLPQFGDGPLLYQRKPILRVVMPGSVAPTALHCDADYFHSENELNFWVPLVAVDGRNSLYCESAPGAGDYSPFVSSGNGEAVRFYGNRCRHYTTANDAETRVSLTSESSCKGSSRRRARLCGNAPSTRSTPGAQSAATTRSRTRAGAGRRGGAPRRAAPRVAGAPEGVAV